MTQVTKERARRDLIDAIIADFHTTRLGDGPVSVHILNKPRCRRAFKAYDSITSHPSVEPGIYVASKAKHWPMWQAYRAAGQPILSTWIDEGDDKKTQDFPDLWWRCVSEASRAAVTIVYREDGEELKGALIEIGAAMALGRIVLAVGPFTGTYHNHPLFKPCPDLDMAFLLAAEILALSPMTVKSEPQTDMVSVSREDVAWIIDKLNPPGTMVGDGITRVVHRLRQAMESGE